MLNVRRAFAERRPGPQSLRALVALSLVVVLVVGRVVTSRDRAVHEFVGPTMGTSYRVVVRAPLASGDSAAIRRLVQGELDGVEGAMSTYDSTSELSRFNRHGTETPFVASPALIEILTLADDVVARSQGAFDPTLAPLVDAWGFGPDPGPATPPDRARLQALRAHVGFESIEIDQARSSVLKSDADVRIDLSGIAKGYGVDRVATALANAGYGDVLVEVGGEVKALGTNADGEPWRVGIEPSGSTGAGLWGTIALTGAGVATSGDSRNVYELDGIRYAHIIDPRSATPIPVRGASVTVVHPSTATADAWATALIVLGSDEGYQIARREGVAAVFVTGSGTTVQARSTPLMQARYPVTEARE